MGGGALCFSRRYEKPFNCFFAQLFAKEKRRAEQNSMHRIAPVRDDPICGKVGKY